MTGLANNAAKFTDRGRIALILNKDKDTIRLMVTDTGRGMSPEEVAAVFDTADREFDGEVSAYTGSGLGLRIVKHLVKSLEGNLSVSSKTGEGTIVEVALPWNYRRTLMECEKS
jgi:two-component system, NarL family, sensor histidine kinase EvgS